MKRIRVPQRNLNRKVICALHFKMIPLAIGWKTDQGRSILNAGRSVRGSSSSLGEEPVLD